MSTILQGNPLNQVVTDKTELWFGLHKGQKIANVPARYLIFIYDEKKCPDNVREYIKDNYTVLKKQERDEFIFKKPRNHRLL